MVWKTSITTFDTATPVLSAPKMLEFAPVYERTEINKPTPRRDNTTDKILHVPEHASNGFFEKSRNCLFLLSQKDAHVIENTLPSVFDSTLPEQERLLALGLLFSRLDRLTPPEMRHSFGQVKTYIPQVLRHLNEHIEGRLSADEIAARFHVSRAKLDRDFRASVGQSLHGAIMDLRLSRAMRLLREGIQSVAGVAQLCGFASEEYFYSFFKRATGQTPLQYRNALQ
jgi:AraC-like DNA-binding protein